MLAYMARRMLLAVFTVWAISVLTFFILELPEGDLADRLADVRIALGEPMPESEIERIRQTWGLDRPKYVRYFDWAWNLLHGDLGLSVRYVSFYAETVRPVKKLIGDRIWTTVALTGFTVIVTWTFAIPVGIYSAVRQHSVGDYVFTFLGFTGIAVPDFLLGLLLMYLAFAYFGMSVGGLNSSEYAGDHPWDLGRLLDLLDHLWIPAVVLGTSGTAGLIRVMRNNLLDELGKPYVVTARAKGVHNVKLILKYPLRLALNPLISTVGYLLPALISGSVIVSVVLGLPTLGPILLEAVLLQDSNTAAPVILMLGILTVVGTLISDILLAVVDPRIKFGSR